MTTRVLEANATTNRFTVTAQPLVLKANKPGRPLSSELLLWDLAVIDYRLPQNLTGSRAKSLVAALASTTFTLKKNGSSIGSFNFAASATTATFTFAANVDFTAGTDELTIEAPATQDLNLSDLSISLKGTRL